MRKLKTKIQWKPLLRICTWCLVITGFVVTVSFTEHQQQDMLCSEVLVTIRNPGELAFIEKSDVLQLVHDKTGTPEGKSMKSINISLLENIINNNPFVASAEVFSTIDGKLNIEVTPRKPVARVINNFSESFYIDEQGVFMPLSDKYSASVPVINGFIPDKEAVHKIRTMRTTNCTDTAFHPLNIEKAYLLAGFIV